MNGDAHSWSDDVYGSGRRLLTLDEVAARLGASTEAVQQLVDERRIPFSRPGDALRFDSAAVSLWLETK